MVDGKIPFEEGVSTEDPDSLSVILKVPMFKVVSDADPFSESETEYMPPLDAPRAIAST